jgi:hypothetical protein
LSIHGGDFAGNGGPIGPRPWLPFFVLIGAREVNHGPPASHSRPDK